MSISLYAAASTLQSAQKKVDTISNNLANISTVGYKAQRANFQDLLHERLEQNEVVNLEGRITPLGLQYGHGVRVNEVTRDMSMGNLTETGDPHHLAISGPGMFQLLVSHEQAQRLGVSQEAMDVYDNDQYGYAFTRDGNFRVDARQGYRTLVDPRGYQLSDIYGNPIEFTEDVESVRVDERGNVYLNEDAVPFTQLMVVNFRNPQSLHHAGNNIYVENNYIVGNYQDALNNPDILREARIQQGFVESSNVDMIREMTELVAAQRMLQFGARAIQSTDTMMGITNTIRA